MEKNKMRQVAELLGLNIGDEFRCQFLDGYYIAKMKITREGIKEYKFGYDKWIISDELLREILTGDYFWLKKVEK